MQDPLIKVGYLVSYDYKYIFNSLPTIYKDADQITLAIDKYRQTWSGYKFEIPDSFFEWIKEYDIDNKIKIYEDEFYKTDLTVMECDTRERNMLAVFMGKDTDWHVQIDSDEYFIDFGSFTNFLKTLDINKRTSISCDWITIFKCNNNEIFLIDNKEGFALATNYPEYEYARNTIKLDKHINTKYKVLHQSWGRSETELKQKLDNWSHANDFDTHSYFNLWKAINKHTYQYIHNFHPLIPKHWKNLEFIEADDIQILIEKIKETEKYKADNEQNSLFKTLFNKLRL